MNKTILELRADEKVPDLLQLDTALSFKPFLNFIRKASEKPTIKAKFYQYILEKFNAYPQLNGVVSPQEVISLESILELIYTVISSPLSDESEELLAFSAPFSSTVFFFTNAWKDLLVDPKTGAMKRNVIVDKDNALKKDSMRMVYSLLLERLYQFTFDSGEDDIIYTLTDEETGLPRYFKVELDERFVDISVKNPLPELNFELVEKVIQEPFDFSNLQQIIPLSLFRFEGFVVIRLKDVTSNYAVESIRNNLLDRSECDLQEKIKLSLRTLLGSPDVEFGFFPLLKVNNKLIFDALNCSQSLLFGRALQSVQSEILCTDLVDNYLKNPRMVYFRKINKDLTERHPYLRVLTELNVRSYAAIPIYFNTSVAGLMEVYSFKDGVLDEKRLSRIDPAIPLVSQMMQNLIDEFQAQIDEVIRDRYTSLQPVVQWKFNEVAWKFLRSERVMEPGIRDPEPILFPDVYPLYGSVDIRDSSVKRNAALRLDLQYQFTILLETLEELKTKVQLDLLDKMMFQSRSMLAHITDVAGPDNQLWVDDFLVNEVHSLLQHIRKSYVGTADIIDKYFRATDENVGGTAFRNRKNLEASMRMVNEQVSRTLEYLKNDILNQYPFYFEKFRTDGVEYDIYIGQSLAPDKPFSTIYLRNLRLWQLSSMAALARQTHALKDVMPVPLETTQLIFVHGTPIDISFRIDERRFDVEGAYNIRYQMIKKRIDKVNIMGTNERLTQPGKIAIVYLNRKDADEYISYVRYLQEQNVLDNNLEELELEELQGVSGLKALRVGVKIV